MQRIVSYNTSVTAVATYAALNATPSVYVAPVGKQSNAPAILASATLVCFANTGTTGGVVVPVYLGPDGNYYPLAAATTLTAAGFIFAFQLTSPAPGVAIQITTTVTGGSLNLFCSAVMV